MSLGRLCSNYSSVVLRAIKANFRCAEAFLRANGTIFLLFSSNIETSCQQNKKSSDKLEIPCGTKFLRVLIFTFPASRGLSRQETSASREIFTIFGIFPAIRNNNPPPPPTPFKTNENAFPAKIYSRVLKFTTQKYSTKKSCLFNYNSPLQFRNKTSTMNWFYIMYEYRSTV